MPVRALTPAVLAVVLAASACRAAPEPPQPGERPQLGLMTSLPLIWGEAGEMSDLLKSDARGGWVREALDRRFVIEPLDTLDEAALAKLDRLVLAQPRALSPEENVALDSWVRGGGRLLLFADPMLTRHSRFPVGDRRRPQDVVLLSPILAHWGLELLFDDERAEGERLADIGGASVPVDWAGRFRARTDARCTVSARGVVAQCRLGKGRVIALADAAVLDDAADTGAETRRGALEHLVTLAFD